jgi:hypothetical protein
MTSMNHQMREFLKEYDEEAYERCLENLEIQKRVDLAEKLMVEGVVDYEAVDFGHDDFGHEYTEEDECPFDYFDDYDYGKRDELEEEHNP